MANVIQAVLKRARGKIVWPEPTHARTGSDGGLFGQRPGWIPARDIIDWDIPGQSIFRRKRPLAENTLRRIEAGIRRFWGEWAQAFLVVMRGTSKRQCEATALGMDQPLPTATGAGHVGLVEPFLTTMNNWPSQEGGRSIGAPLPTQTASNHVGLVEPFIMATGQTGGGERTQSMDAPLGTVVTKAEHCLLSPFITTVSHGTPDGNFARRTRSVDESLPCLTGSNDHALVRPFIIPQHSSGRPRDMSEPVATITTDGASALIQPFLVSFYGQGEARAIDEPIATITTKDRFGVVQQYGLDILFRMLQPHELARAHSFPKDYRFAGSKTDIVKQIGNSVPCLTAAALCQAALGNGNP